MKRKKVVKAFPVIAILLGIYLIIGALIGLFLPPILNYYDIRVYISILILFILGFFLLGWGILDSLYAKT